MSEKKSQRVEVDGLTVISPGDSSLEDRNRIREQLRLLAEEVWGEFWRRPKSKR